MSNKLIGLLIAIVGIIGLVIWGISIMRANPDAATSLDDPMEVEAQEPTSLEGTEQESRYQYVEYDPAAVAKAATNGTAVLFFHASWCPTCKVANIELTERSDELPEGVTVFKVDYDTANDLKERYNITYQHTFVQVDAAGNELAKWNGGSIREIAENIK